MAAWIKAETGVGPAIASGNQVNNGICADFPVTPTKSNKVINTIAGSPIEIDPKLPRIVCISSDLNLIPNKKMPETALLNFY